ncbi:hypothetical protein ACFVX3_19675 [Rhodococcus erythropolis]
MVNLALVGAFTGVAHQVLDQLLRDPGSGPASLESHVAGAVFNYS